MRNSKLFNIFATVSLEWTICKIEKKLQVFSKKSESAATNKFCDKWQVLFYRVYFLRQETRNREVWDTFWNIDKKLNIKSIIKRTQSASRNINLFFQEKYFSGVKNWSVLGKKIMCGISDKFDILRLARKILNKDWIFFFHTKQMKFSSSKRND